MSARRAFERRSALHSKPKRRRFKGGPVAPLLSDLCSRRLPVRRVIRALCGTGPRGQEWERDLLDTMTRMRVDDEALGTEAQAGGAERECARAWLATMLDLCGNMRRHGGQLAVRGQAGFWGRQHEQVARCPSRVEHERIEKAHELELSRDMLPDEAWEAAKKAVPTSERRSVPKERAGGLAARRGRSVRTIGRYAAIARAGRFLGSRQPPAPGFASPEATTDAVMPRNGKWAYPTWRFLRQPPEALLQALRVWWGEVVIEETEAGPVPRTLGLKRPPATVAGPRAPPLDVAEIAAAHPELDVLEDLDVLALAKLRATLETRPGN